MRPERKPFSLTQNYKPDKKTQGRQEEVQFAREPPASAEVECWEPRRWEEAREEVGEKAGVEEREEVEGKVGKGAVEEVR